jgi:hypothetical protein
MAISDVYTFKSGSVALAGTAAVPVLSVIGTAAKRAWMVGIEINVGVTAAAAGNSLLFQLARPANTPTATGGFGGNPEDFSAPASVVQGFPTYTTAPTVGAVLWEKELPQTTGSAWSYYPPTGYEFGIPAIANAAANAGLHMFVTPSVATSTPVFVDLICSE